MDLSSILNRRASLAMLAASPLAFTALSACAGTRNQRSPVPALRSLEAKAGGRLGVAILDSANGALVGYRMEERFALCSTFKLVLAAEVLRAIDAGHLTPDHRIEITQADLVPHAPVTGPSVGQGGMSVLELAMATQQTSDNVAANLLIRHFGGPSAVTDLMRAAGDGVTRLDRYEPSLNLVAPGDERDTTSPAAMAQLTMRYLCSDYLTSQSQQILAGWMIQTKTGLRRLRAGLPGDWRAGDKTGTVVGAGGSDKYNDVAIVWPPGRAPVIVAAYYNSAEVHDQIEERFEAVLGDVGRIVVDVLAS